MKTKEIFSLLPFFQIFQRLTPRVALCVRCEEIFKIRSVNRSDESPYFLQTYLAQTNLSEAEVAKDTPHRRNTMS